MVCARARWQAMRVACLSSPGCQVSNTLARGGTLGHDARPGARPSQKLLSQLSLFCITPVATRLNRNYLPDTTQNIRAAVIRVFVLCGGVLMHSELRSHPRGAPALVTPAHYIAVLSELEAPCISKMEAQTAESQGMSILCSLQCTRRSAATHNQNQL